MERRKSRNPRTPALIPNQDRMIVPPKQLRISPMSLDAKCSAFQLKMIWISKRTESCSPKRRADRRHRFILNTSLFVQLLLSYSIWLLLRDIHFVSNQPTANWYIFQSQWRTNFHLFRASQSLLSVIFSFHSRQCFYEYLLILFCFTTRNN